MSLIPSGELKEVAAFWRAGDVIVDGINESNSLRGVESTNRQTLLIRTCVSMSLIPSGELKDNNEQNTSLIHLPYQ